MTIEQLAAEARDILTAWAGHEDQCNAFYCDRERCDYSDRLTEREAALLEHLAAMAHEAAQ